MTEKLGSNYVNIAFYKSDIVRNYDKDGRNMSVIAFPKQSKYAGYVWHFPTLWIKDNEKAKDDPAYSFNPDKRWVSMKDDNDVHIVKSVLNMDTHQFEKEDEIILKATDLKEFMKRPYKANNANGDSNK